MIVSSTGSIWECLAVGKLEDALEDQGSSSGVVAASKSCKKISDSLWIMPSTSGVNLQINGNQITCSRSSLHTRKQNNNYPVQKNNEYTVTKILTKIINELKRKI